MATTPPVHGVALVASPALQAAVSEAASTVPGLKMHVELVQPEAILARAAAHGDEAHLLLVDARPGEPTADGELAALSAGRGRDCPTLVSAEGLDLDRVRRLHRDGSKFLRWLPFRRFRAHGERTARPVHSLSTAREDHRFVTCRAAAHWGRTVRIPGPFRAGRSGRPARRPSPRSPSPSACLPRGPPWSRSGSAPARPRAARTAGVRRT